LDGFLFGISSLTSKHCVKRDIIEIMKSDDKQKLPHSNPVLLS
jgi:hypothetical protein